jgi:hypothetical protein
MGTRATTTGSLTGGCGGLTSTSALAVGGLGVRGSAPGATLLLAT